MIKKSTRNIAFGLTLLILVVVSNKHTSAGVIVDNGVITTATLDGGNGNQVVYFTNDSYDSLKSDPATDNMPWYDETVTTTNAPLLAVKLAEAMNSNGSVTDTNNLYIFVISEPSPNHNSEDEFIVSLVYYNIEANDPADQRWEFYFEIFPNFDPTSKLYSQGGEATWDMYIATSNTSNSNNNVPEPSTAIAMGLLGIVGFAGNRRRRRQVSVA